MLVTQQGKMDQRQKHYERLTNPSKSDLKEAETLMSSSSYPNIEDYNTFMYGTNFVKDHDILFSSENRDYNRGQFLVQNYNKKLPLSLLKTILTRDTDIMNTLSWLFTNRPNYFDQLTKNELAEYVDNILVTMMKADLSCVNAMTFLYEKKPFNLCENKKGENPFFLSFAFITLKPSIWILNKLTEFKAKTKIVSHVDNYDREEFSFIHIPREARMYNRCVFGVSQETHESLLREGYVFDYEFATLGVREDSDHKQKYNWRKDLFLREDAITFNKPFKPPLNTLKHYRDLGCIQLD